MAVLVCIFAILSSSILWAYLVCLNIFFSLQGWDENVYVHAEYSHKAAQVSVTFVLFSKMLLGKGKDCSFSLCRLPLISVALVEGNALGGGAELTTACDFRSTDIKTPVSIQSLI